MYEFLVRTAVTTNEEAVWPSDQWARNPAVQGSRRHLLVFFSEENIYRWSRVQILGHACK